MEEGVPLGELGAFTLDLLDDIVMGEQLECC